MSVLSRLPTSIAMTRIIRSASILDTTSSVTSAVNDLSEDLQIGLWPAGDARCGPGQPSHMPRTCTHVCMHAPCPERLHDGPCLVYFFVFCVFRTWLVPEHHNDFCHAISEACRVVATCKLQQVGMNNNTPLLKRVAGSLANEAHCGTVP